MITILANYERISLFHTMLPFLAVNRQKKIFKFTQSADWCLTKDKNDTLFMERCFQHREPRDMEEGELELLKKLRNKYKKIVFFCGQPEAGNNRMDILPYVDKLFYKSVFTDRGNYCKNLYGKNLFSDFYHTQYGIKDNPQYIFNSQLTKEDSLKPELSWNIGLGTYPRWNMRQRLGTILARTNMPSLGNSIGSMPLKKMFSGLKDFSDKSRSINVHARIDPVTCPSIAHQRVLFLDIISKLPEENKKLFLTGMTSQKHYYSELKKSKIVLSPFGWGEVCFRDFEAILCGALLLKPDMSHLVTWPNVYIPNETYVPLKWDGSDLLEKSLYYLNDDAERNRIASNAFEKYKNELSSLSKRAQDILGEYLA